MAETAAHLVDRVLPIVPIRQWVLSLPRSLSMMLGYEPALLGAAMQVFVRAVLGWIRGKVRERIGPVDARDVQPGAVTFVQRFGDALDLNPHFHSLVLDGAYVVRHGRFEGFVAIEPPRDQDIARLAAQVAKRIERMLRRRGKLGSRPSCAASSRAIPSAAPAASAATCSRSRETSSTSTSARLGRAVWRPISTSTRSRTSLRRRARCCA